MATLSLELDSKEKTLSVKIDGKEVPNVSNVDISHFKYSDLDTWISFCVETSEKYGDISDVHKTVRLCGSESQEAKAAIADGTAKPSQFKDVVSIPGLTKAQKSLMEWRSK